MSRAIDSAWEALAKVRLPDHWILEQEPGVWILKRSSDHARVGVVQLVAGRLRGVPVPCPLGAKEVVRVSPRAILQALVAGHPGWMLWRG